MVIDENLEDELSSWLSRIEFEGLGAVDEGGQEVLSHETEGALIEALQRLPLAECIDTAANAKAQLDEMDAAMEAIALINELVGRTDSGKPRVDSALELLGSYYRSLSEKLLRSSALLDLTQEMTGARIMLRPALESGVQGTFLLTAVRPKTQSILLSRWNEIGPDIRNFLKVFKPFRGLHTEPPSLDAIVAAASKLRLKFRHVVSAMDKLMMFWPIPSPQDYVGGLWEALSAESHVNALQSIFTTSPVTDEIELKGEMKDFRRSYPNLFVEVVDVLVVSQINYLKISNAHPEPFRLSSDQRSALLERCSKGRLGFSKQLFEGASSST